MMSRLTIFKNFALMLGAVLFGLAGTAKAATCGITGSASSTGAVYDPFNPTAATAHVTLNLIRIDPLANGDKTAVVSFYLTSTNPAATGTQIIPTSVVVAGLSSFVPGANIFYNTGSTGPIMGPPTGKTSPSAGNAYLEVAFTGNNAASNPASVNFDVILPPSSNFNASTNLLFDATFRCTTTGGGGPTDQQGSLTGAMQFPVTVLSALKTYYAGTALDFGEIGNITNASLLTTSIFTLDPGSQNYIKVLSSGAYSVALTSANGFKLKRPGATTVNDEVAYQLIFMGQTPSPGPPSTFTTQTCARAGITAAGEILPIKAKLLEGGSGKTPSPTYADILTVTITPLAYSTVAPIQCGSL